VVIGLCVEMLDTGLNISGEAFWKRRTNRRREVIISTRK
jgi:hypothetical protein